MTATRPTLILALTGLLLLGSVAQAGDFTIDAESLAAAVREVRPQIEKETGVDLSKVTIRLGTREDLSRTLLAEVTAQLTITLGDAEAAKAQAKLLTTLMVDAMLAKYSYSEKTVFVSAENFVKLAALVDEPGLATAEGLRAVLVHECVHAADDLKFDLEACIKRLKGQEGLMCFSAVLEGHAQVVTRRVCAGHGWEKGFETFTRSIGKMPEDMEEGQKILARAMTSALTSACSDGETFMTFVEAKGGAKGVARAFRETPHDIALIDNPAWFLDPSLRPAKTYDLKAALEALAKRFPKDEWTITRTALTKGQLRGALEMMPKEDLDWFLDALVDCRLVVIQPSAAPQSKMVIAALYEMPRPVDSERALKLTNALNRLKDEKMKTGTIRVTSAKYEDVAGTRWSGELARKKVQAGLQEVAVSSLIARRGAVTLELVYSAYEADRKQITADAETILSAVFVKAKKPVETGK